MHALPAYVSREGARIYAYGSCPRCSSRHGYTRSCERVRHATDAELTFAIEVVTRSNAWRAAHDENGNPTEHTPCHS